MRFPSGSDIREHHDPYTFRDGDGTIPSIMYVHYSDEDHGFMCIPSLAPGA